MMRRRTAAQEQIIRHTLVKRGMKQVPGQETVAYVDEGRWIARCVCNGGEEVIEGADMICGSCGRVNPVTWPDNAAEIDELLDKRELVNQWWFPHETVADLKRENREHGLD